MKRSETPSKLDEFRNIIATNFTLLNKSSSSGSEIWYLFDPPPSPFAQWEASSFDFLLDYRIPNRILVIFATHFGFVAEGPGLNLARIPGHCHENGKKNVSASKLDRTPCRELKGEETSCWFVKWDFAVRRSEEEEESVLFGASFQLDLSAHPPWNCNNN